MATRTTTASATRSITGLVLGVMSLLLVVAALVFFQLALHVTTTVYSPLAGGAFLLAIPLAIIGLVMGRRTRARLAPILSSLALLGVLGELVAYVIYVANVIR